jgi:hypothetical protein
MLPKLNPNKVNHSISTLRDLHWVSKQLCLKLRKNQELKLSNLLNLNLSRLGLINIQTLREHVSQIILTRSKNQKLNSKFLT